VADQAIGDFIRDTAAEDPDRPLVSFADETMTWGDLDAESDVLARALRNAGVAQNATVAIILPNGFSFVRAVAATWKLGATPQLLSPRMVRTERDELLELARPAACITYLNLASEVTVVNPDAVPVAASEPTGPSPVTDRWVAYASGGSTGRPKIVTANARGVVGENSDLMHGARGYELDSETVMMLPGPLCHAGPFGLFTYTLVSRGRIVLMDHFDAEETLRLVERHGVTTLFLVPTMMHRIMQLDPAIRRRYDLSTLHTMTHAAAPCAPWLKEQWIEWLGPKRISESYGGSDSAGMTRISGSEWLERRGSVGRPAIGEVAIFDAAGGRLPPGEIGDIYMLPPEGAMSRTYIGAPPPATRDGWWSIGDMGWLDEDGYLYLADRRVDLIITGGLNVYPAEVEGVLESHPAVMSSVVVGVRDDDWGKRVHAVVQAHDPLDPEELRAFVAQRLSSYKVPKSIEFVDEPLRDEAGKVRRSAVAAQAEQKARP
jgi:bile acid-coenzyme A ligase